MLVYPAALDVSSTQLQLLTDLLTAHRKATGTLCRRLSPQRQALLVLAYLRKNETYTALAAGFHIGVATVFRYTREGVRLLAERAPTLPAAVTTAARKAYLVLDGTLIRTDRVRMTKRGADAPFYCGKAHHHGMNIQVIADPLRELLWASPAVPGSSHDITCARTHGLPEALEPLTAAGTPVLADRGYIGIKHGIRVPIMARGRTQTGAFRRRELSRNEKAYNTAHGTMRAFGERGNAQPKSWKVLSRLRCSPEQATPITAAVTTLITAGQTPSWK